MFVLQLSKILFLKKYEAHTLTLLMKIKMSTHPVTLICTVLFKSSRKFCKIEGWGGGFVKSMRAYKAGGGHIIRNICIRTV